MLIRKEKENNSVLPPKYIMAMDIVMDMGMGTLKEEVTVTDMGMVLIKMRVQVKI